MSNIDPIVYLVDDDERILVALRRLLICSGYNVRTYRTAEDFLTMHDPDAPGCVVLDIALPGMDGFGIQNELWSRHHARPLIFLTGCGDIPTTVRAMKAGAVDFLTKPVDAASLLAAIEQALQLDEKSRQKALQRRLVGQRLASLTPREREVFGCVVAGQLNKQIAAELGTVEKTIKVHRGRMMEKMCVRTVADLVRLAAVAAG
ncbi:MAG TPA: response regulator [Pararhizobium sp.]|uniref:response regulator transcription factor n=1 Tax=Pararhizobium sp. TaxID=1977563 RepID=UPI002C4C72E3|nr:response regulator [Pararhizobium sp.]HTO31546.1 response regulator [Pararhizobium sp.]